MAPADHHCLDATGYHDYTMRVLTGKIIYRMSSKRNDKQGGPHVWCRQVHHTGKLGARELVNVDDLNKSTDYILPTPES